MAVRSEPENSLGNDHSLVRLTVDQFFVYFRALAQDCGIEKNNKNKYRVTASFVNISEENIEVIYIEDELLSGQHFYLSGKDGNPIQPFKGSGKWGREYMKYWRIHEVTIGKSLDVHFEVNRSAESISVGNFHYAVEAEECPPVGFYYYKMKSNEILLPHFEP